jgi:ABC-type multidrug transport system ATPase subunit
MKITLTNAGKRFNRDWIFRHLSYEFFTGQSYAITGPNGSGKSTLLQLIAGATAPSEGSITYTDAETSLATEFIYQHISLSAPYLELVEEMTLTEFLVFHHRFKPFRSTLSVSDVIESVQLNSAAEKQIRNFSSGMKQRVKLAQAIFSDVPVILLDEPCTNLDLDGIVLYQQLIKKHVSGKLVIVSSNDEQEYSFCEHKLEVFKYH